MRNKITAMETGRVGQHSITVVFDIQTVLSQSKSYISVLSFMRKCDFAPNRANVIIHLAAQTRIVFDKKLPGYTNSVNIKQFQMD